MMVIMAFIAGRRRHQAQSCVTLKARLKPCTAIRRGIVSAHLQRPGPPAGPPRCVARGPSGTPGLRPPAQGPGSPDAGNTLTRNVTGGKQTLTWAHDGKLATDTTPAGTTSYVYDADGNLLLQKDPGQTTFYPFGGAEQIILNATTGAVTGTRFLALPGGGLATPVANPVTDSDPTGLYRICLADCNGGQPYCPPQVCRNAGATYRDYRYGNPGARNVHNRTDLG